MERTLNAVFFPSVAARIGGESTIAESLFHISASGRLIDEPIIASALLLLSLVSPQIDHADAGAVLRSPFVAGAMAEKHERALADVELRKRRELNVRLADLEKVSHRCSILLSCWQRLRKLLPKLSPARHSSGVERIDFRCAAGHGLARRQRSDGARRAMVERWKAQLSTLSSLGLVSPPLRFEAALAHLRRLLSVAL